MSGDDYVNVATSERQMLVRRASGLALPGGNVAPTNTVLPVITGTLTVGQTLTSSTGTWTGSVPITYTYQWKRAGVAIGGAIASTYTLVTADGGALITVTVTGTNAFGNSSATSAAAGPIVAIGGAFLLTGETDGLAVDFKYVSDADRVAVKTAGVATGYGIDAFYQNTGASAKQVWDVNGVLNWSPHNLCVQSEDLRVSWSVLAGSATSAILFVPDTANTTHRIMQLPITAQIGQTFTHSMVVSNGGYPKIGIIESGTNFIGVVFDLSTGTKIWQDTAGNGTITSLGGGQYLITSTLTTAAASLRFLIYPLPDSYTSGAFPAWSGDGVKGINIHRSQTNQGRTVLPYLKTTTAVRYGLAVDYDPLTHACKGLLYEPSVANIILQSSAFAGGPWANTGLAITSNTMVAPDGALTADTYTASGNANNILYPIAANSAAGGTFTASIYLKAGTANWVVLELWTGSGVGTGVRVWFNPQTGTFGQANALTTGTYVSSVRTVLPNGWYRIELTGTWPAANVFWAMNIVDGDGAHNFTAVSGLTFHLWGAQLELGTFASSHIPTYAASVTRGVDNYTALLNTIPPLGSEYSIYCRFSTPTPNTSRYPYVLTDGTTNEYVGFITATYTALVVQDGGVQVGFAVGPAIAANTSHGMTARVKLNDCAYSLNGAAIIADTAVTLPTPTEIRFGNNGTNAAASAPFLLEKMSVITNRGWSNAELVAKSPT